MLILVIPVYNEEENIARLLAKIVRLNQKMLLRKLIIVDDGSIDETVERIRAFDNSLPITVLSFSVNRGPGAVFEDGLREALSVAHEDDIIGTLEADTTSDLTILPRMLAKIKTGADVVLASCYSPMGGKLTGLPLERKLLSLGANSLLKMLFPIRGIHTYSSFYRLYRPIVLKRVIQEYGGLFTEPGFVCMVELLIRLGRLPVQIAEVPMTLHFRKRKGASKMKIAKTIRAYVRVMIRALLQGSRMRANLPEG